MAHAAPARRPIHSLADRGVAFWSGAIVGDSFCASFLLFIARQIQGPFRRLLTTRGIRYIDRDTLQYWMELYGSVMQPINGHTPRVLAVWTGHPRVAWLFHVFIDQEFEPIGEFGTYTILVRKS